MNKHNTLYYQKNLVIFILVYKFIFPALAAAIAWIALSRNLSGAAQIICYFISVVLLAVTALLWLNRKNMVQVTDEGIEITKRSKSINVAFKDIKAIKDNGKAIILEGDNGVLAKFSALTYDLEDLGKFLELICNKTKLTPEDIEKETSIDRFFNNDIIPTAIQILSFIDIIYLIASINIFPGSLVPYLIASLVVPLFPFAYYVYLFHKADWEHITAYRILFLLTMLLPIMALVLIITTKYAISGFDTILYTTIIVFAVFYLGYKLLCNLKGMSTDAFFWFYVLVLIPVLLITLNICLPAKESKTYNAKVTGLQVRSIKFFGLDVLLENEDGGDERFVIKPSRSSEYETGKEYTIESKTGIFNLTYKKLND